MDALRGTSDGRALTCNYVTAPAFPYFSQAESIHSLKASCQSVQEPTVECFCPEARGVLSVEEGLEAMRLRNEPKPCVSHRFVQVKGCPRPPPPQPPQIKPMKSQEGKSLLACFCTKVSTAVRPLGHAFQEHHEASSSSTTSSSCQP